MQENINKISLCRKVRNGRIMRNSYSRRKGYIQQHDKDDEEINQIKRKQHVTTYETDDISV